jgi:TolB-like protein/tetratricopeptide (TPR) repeat protein
MDHHVLRTRLALQVGPSQYFGCADGAAQGMRSGLIARLRERGVLRVAASYAVIAWLVLQIADVALEPWDLPGWVRRAPLVIALLGFPIAIALAWFFELGDGAVTLDAAHDGTARPTVHGWRRHADIVVISVLGAAVAYFLARDAGWLGEAARPGARIESSSLAVLPFANIGAYAEQHISDGLSDELRSEFSRMQSIRVTARSSSIAFEGQSLDAVTIAGKLAVAALLEGTVGRGGGRLQVSVQLIDGKSGKVMWADRYDRPDRDLLAVQTEIANEVVAAVLPRFAASGKAALPPPTDDPVAYDLYLLGRQKLREAEQLELSADWTGASTSEAQAADFFRSAIAADPEFSLAHSGLAAARRGPALRLLDESTGPDRAAAADRELMPHIERALALDPKNAEAYYQKGLLLKQTFRPGAEAAFRRAVELDPSDARATLQLGWSAIANGRIDERHRLVMRSLDLDPMDPTLYGFAIISAWILGRGDELRSIVDRMLSRFPDSPEAVFQQCWSRGFLGFLDETLACIEKARTRFAENADFVRELDHLAAGAWEGIGDDARALRIYDRLAVDDANGALDAMRLRRDVPALRRVAEESLARQLSIFDWEIGEALARVGLAQEAIEVLRHAGIAEVMDSDLPYKTMILPGIVRLAGLLKAHGENEDAQRLLTQTTELLETMRSHGARASGVRLSTAKVYALAGRNDEAIEQLALAVETPDWPQQTAAATETDPALAELRDDPRFEAQVKRLRDREAQARARLPETFRRQGLDWPPQ